MIEFENVSYGYQDRLLFSNLSLALEPGSFHFLTGPSGAGKTTLMRLAYGDLRAKSGVVRVFGKDAAMLDRDAVAVMRRRIGVVHQDCAFLDHLTLAENVRLPLEVAGRLDEATENLPELLNWVGLSAQAEQLPPTLSGGERQRGALARAVIMTPEVIVADEPTGNIDWDMAKRLMGLLIELNKLGKTILIATHDLGLIRSVQGTVTARVLRLRAGKVELAGADL